VCVRVRVPEISCVQSADKEEEEEEEEEEEDDEDDDEGEEAGRCM
jgi:hypothetical protein